MTLEQSESTINDVKKYFGKDYPDNLYISKIVVNDQKHAILFSTVPVGELFSSTINKETGAKKLIVDIEQEIEINADR